MPQFFSLVLSYFVEDVCSLLRDTRFALADLDVLHWRVAWFQEQQTPALPRDTPAAAGTVCPPSSSHSHRKVKSREADPNSIALAPCGVFSDVSDETLLRAAELAHISFEDDRVPPRFLVWLDEPRGGGTSKEVSDAAALLKSCWMMLLQFMSAQVKHAQTMMFAREPRLRDMMASLPSIKQTVAAAVELK